VAAATADSKRAARLLALRLYSALSAGAFFLVFFFFFFFVAISVAYWMASFHY